jgi:hypothetical protein
VGQQDYRSWGVGVYEEGEMEQRRECDSNNFKYNRERVQVEKLGSV